VADSLQNVEKPTDSTNLGLSTILTDARPRLGALAGHRHCEHKGSDDECYAEPRKIEFYAGLLPSSRQTSHLLFARLPSKMTSPKTTRSRHSANELHAPSSRFLITFCIGGASTLAWQSYGDAARAMIANSYPQLGWFGTAIRSARASNICRLFDHAAAQRNVVDLDACGKHRGSLPV